MSSPRSKQQILEADYLPIRAKILEIGAAFDRLDQAEGALQDARQEQLRAAVKILLHDDPQRAEQIQLLFSREFEPDWRQKFDL